MKLLALGLCILSLIVSASAGSPELTSTDGYLLLLLGMLWWAR